MRLSILSKLTLFAMIAATPCFISAQDKSEQSPQPNSQSSNTDSTETSSSVTATPSAGASSSFNHTPLWASIDDKCTIKRSCDFCHLPLQYCKYQEDGQPSCCSAKQTKIEPMGEDAEDRFPEEEEKLKNAEENNSQQSQKDEEPTDSNSEVQRNTRTKNTSKSKSSSAATDAEVEPNQQTLDDIQTRQSKQNTQQLNKSVKQQAKTPTESHSSPSSSSSSAQFICYDVTASTKCDPTETPRILPLKTGQQHQCCMKAMSAVSAPIQLPDWSSDSDECVEVSGGCDVCQTTDTQYCRPVEMQCCKKSTLNKKTNSGE